MRRMLNPVFGVGLLLAALVVTPVTQAQTVEGEPGEWTWTRKFDEPIGNTDQIRLTDFSGNLNVTGTEGSAITVMYRQRIDLESAERVREVAASTTVRFEQMGGVLTIQPSEWISEASWIELEVAVPLGVELQLGAVAGNVRVEDLDASVDIETNAGNVTVSQVDGMVRVRSPSTV